MHGVQLKWRDTAPQANQWLKSDCTPLKWITLGTPEACNPSVVSK